MSLASEFKSCSKFELLCTTFNELLPFFKFLTDPIKDSKTGLSIQGKTRYLWCCGWLLGCFGRLPTNQVSLIFSLPLHTLTHTHMIHVQAYLTFNDN